MHDTFNVKTPPAIATEMPETENANEIPPGNIPAEPPLAILFGEGDPVKGNVLARVLLPLKTKSSKDVLGCFGDSKGNVNCLRCDLNNPVVAVLDKEMTGHHYLSVSTVRSGDDRHRVTLQQLHPHHLALNWLTGPPLLRLHDDPPTIMTTLIYYGQSIRPQNTPVSQPRPARSSMALILVVGKSLVIRGDGVVVHGVSHFCKGSPVWEGEEKEEITKERGVGGGGHRRGGRGHEKRGTQHGNRVHGKS